MKVCMLGLSKQVLYHGFLGVSWGPFSFGQGSAWSPWPVRSSVAPNTTMCDTFLWKPSWRSWAIGSHPLAIAPSVYESTPTTHKHVTNSPCSWPLQTRKPPQVQQLWGCSDPDNLPLSFGPCQDHLNRDPFYTLTLERMVVSRQVPVTRGKTEFTSQWFRCPAWSM